MLKAGPMSIGVAAGNSCWRYYESGVLSSANNCPTSLDHGVAVVGIHYPEKEEEEQFRRKCRVASPDEVAAGECIRQDETLEGKSCCRYFPIRAGFLGSVQDDHDDPDADKTYWIV